VHQVVVDDTGLRVSTLAGFYGNKQSQLLLEIPRDHMLEVVFLPPGWRGARCRTLYLDEQDEARTLLLAAVDNELSTHTGFTALVAQAIDRIRTNKLNAEPLHYEYTLQPVRISIKLLYLPLIILAFILVVLGLHWGPMSQTALAAGFFVALFGSAALAATLIDAVRLHTAWPVPFKVAAYAGAVLFALMVVVAGMGVADIIR
jgi:hypothetical protein